MSFAYGSGVGDSSIAAIEALAAESSIPLTPTSTYRAGAGYHGTYNAVDFSNGGGSSGTSADPGTPQMDAFAAWWLQYAPYLLELIHVNQDGTGTYVKNGQIVDGFTFYGAATLEQHHNHVHVAATNSGIQAATGQGPVQPAQGAAGSDTGGGLTSSKGFAIFSAGFWQRIGIGAAGVLIVILALDITKRGLHV